MAVPTLQTWTDFQNDMIVRYQTLFGFSNVLYAIVTGAQVSPEGVVTHDPSQERITPLSAEGREAFVGGKQIRIPIQVAEVPGAAGVGRAGIWPVTAPMDTAQADIKLCELVAPVGVDIALEEDAQNGQLTALNYVENLTASAYRGLARAENDMLHGNGSGILATNSATDATGLTMTTDPTVTNYDQLTIGRVVDIRNKTTGADPGQGLRRKIVGVNRTTGVITFSTTQVASDGGTGNIVLAGAAIGTWGIFIDSTFDTGSSGGKAMQGLAQCATTPGTTFEAIDSANVGSWNAVQTNGGATALSDADFEDQAYQLAGFGVEAPDYAIAHPKVVDPYKDAKTQFLMIQPQTRVVPSGFSGIIVQVANKDFPLVKDLAAPRKACRVFTTDNLKVYGSKRGPDFIKDDGGMWRFFNRASYKEATILDRAQLAVRTPNHVGIITNVTG
jgi:hypothetical protein